MQSVRIVGLGSVFGNLLPEQRGKGAHGLNVCKTAGKLAAM